MITSPRNRLVAEAIRLHRSRGRREAGATLLEGPTLVGEARRSGASFRQVFATEDDPVGRALDATIVTPEVLRRLGTTETPQSPIAVMEIPASRQPDGGRVLVAWGVGDPGNCGTLIRSAAAFGYGYLSGPGSADPWSPKVLRAAAGAHFQTTVATVSDLAEVRHGGRRLYATVPRGGKTPGRLPEDAAVLMGSEPHGLPDEVITASDERVTVAMASGVESLNAGVAGSIVAHLGAMGSGTNLPAP